MSLTLTGSADDVSAQPPPPGIELSARVSIGGVVGEARTGRGMTFARDDGGKILVMDDVNAAGDRASRNELWGTGTAKAVDNFPISGELITMRVVHWLGRVKSAAAAVNAELGLIDDDLAAEVIEAAGAGDHDDQFPVDVFQTGSGTSSNMNANEVISALTNGAAHPNDYMNLGQSSNDVFPSAVHLAALEAARVHLVPTFKALRRDVR